jgi:phosphoglycolate phosphatase
MNHYTNILFDLDGTLINTKSGVLGSVKKAFEALSLTPPPDDVLEGFMGPPLSDCFTEVCGLDTEQAKTAVQVFRRYYESGGVYDAAPYAGVKELLNALKSAGRALGVATSKNHRFAGIVLAHCGLAEFFDSVAGAPDSLDPPWTKKDSIITAMASLPGADAENTVLVGDRKFDAYGAQEAGIDAIGVLFGFGKAAELEKSPFVCIAKDVDALRALLLP